jgi:hypothetical protein
MSRAAERVATRIRHQRTSSFGSASEACAPEAIRHQAEREAQQRLVSGALFAYPRRRLMSNSTITMRTAMMRMGIPTVTVTASMFPPSTAGLLDSGVYGVSPIELPSP